MVDMEIDARRRLLETTSNPDGRLDYVITLSGRLGRAADAPRLTLRYVPDRLILEEKSFAAYLDALAETRWPTLEAATTAVLDDLNNELVARWVQLTVTAETAEGRSATEHAVYLEDRQPSWDNEALLSRLKRG